MEARGCQLCAEGGSWQVRASLTLAAFVYTDCDSSPFFEPTKPDASACHRKQTQIVSAVLQFFRRFSLACRFLLSHLRLLLLSASLLLFFALGVDISRS